MNVNVTLPLDVVAAILSLGDEPSGDEAKAAITPAAAQAIVAGVKTLPFLVAANSSAGERKRKREEDSISVWVLGCYRDVARISIIHLPQCTISRMPSGLAMVYRMFSRIYRSITKTLTTLKHCKR